MTEEEEKETWMDVLLKLKDDQNQSNPQTE